VLARLANRFLFLYFAFSIGLGRPSRFRSLLFSSAEPVSARDPPRQPYTIVLARWLPDGADMKSTGRFGIGFSTPKMKLKLIYEFFQTNILNFTLCLKPYLFPLLGGLGK